MEDAFEIHSPEMATTGDYIGFVVQDGPKTIPGRISRTVLTTWDSNADEIEAFYAQKDRIRKAAYEILRQNPGLDTIELNSYTV